MKGTSLEFKPPEECVSGSDVMKPFSCLTLYLIETPFNAFANRADTDQAALVRAGSTLFAFTRAA